MGRHFTFTMPDHLPILWELVFRRFRGTSARIHQEKITSDEADGGHEDRRVEVTCVETDAERPGHHQADQQRIRQRLCVQRRLGSI